MDKKAVTKAALTEMVADSEEGSEKENKCPECGCNCGGKK